MRKSPEKRRVEYQEDYYAALPSSAPDEPVQDMPGASRGFAHSESSLRDTESRGFGGWEVSAAGSSAISSS